METCNCSLALSRLYTILVALLLICAMTSLPLVSARVDYNCVFGEMITTETPEGETLQFCPTNMNPPVMNKGEFIWAFKGTSCYECVCEEDLGLACCECPRKRRRG